MRIRGAGYTFGLYPGIDGTGKAAVFDYAYGFAGKIRQSFSFPGILNPAAVHSEHTAGVLEVYYLLDIDIGIKPKFKRLN